MNVARHLGPSEQPTSHSFCRNHGNRMMHAARALLVLSLTLAASCERTDGSGSGSRVSDSAGVAIVESTHPVWTATDTWRVDSASIVVGAEDGGPGQQLHRVTGAVRLGDGTLVIANGGTRELYRYDAGGRFLGVSGKLGDGPGEFRALTWIGRTRGDSVLTWDRGANRITVFSPTGPYARDYRPTLTGNPMTLEGQGYVGRGRILLTMGASFISADGTVGVQRQPITAWIVDSSGAELRAIGPFPGRAVYLGPGREANSITRIPVPLGASTLFAAGPERVHVVDTDALEIRTYGIDGRLARIVRRPHTAIAIEPSDVAAAIETELEGLPPSQEIRAGMRAALERIPPPTHLPAVRALRSDSEGNVWVQVGDRPTVTESAWSVFDSTGRWLGDVAMPAAQQILEIGADYLIVRDRDDLDVERVRVLRLGKPDQ